MRMLDCRARVIGDDCHGLHRQFADAPAVQQVGQAVIELADHDEHPPRPVAQRKLPVHRVFGGNRCELCADHFARCLARIELDPHEEGIARPVVELLRFEDVAAAFEQERRDARGDARAIGAGQGQD